MRAKVPVTHVYPNKAHRCNSSRIGVRASAILVVVVSVTFVTFAIADAGGVGGAVPTR